MHLLPLKKRSMTKVKAAKIEIPSFRGFNWVTGEVVYCFKKCSPKTAFMCNHESWGFYPVVNNLVSIDVCLSNPTNSILSRGSGRYDSSGLEIFEYDIVKNLTSEFSVGNEKCFLFGEIYYRNGVFYESYFNMPISHYQFLEVVGNRFETPELLNSCPPVEREENND